MDTTQKLVTKIEGLNNQMQQINKDIAGAVKSQDNSRMREILEQVGIIRNSLKEYHRGRDGITRKIKVKETPIKQIVRNPDKADTPAEDFSLTKLWGDQRMNPYWLKTAEYFGLKEKDYAESSSKISEILDWAANKGKTRKMGEILGLIGNTLKKLQSPGLSDRSYAVLHRYIVLSQERAKASPEVQKEITKEMSAYEA